MPKHLLDTGALACFCHLIRLAFARTNISALNKTFSITWIRWSQVELLGPEIYLLPLKQNRVNPPFSLQALSRRVNEEIGARKHESLQWLWSNGKP